jgi:hypothetical protein
VSPHATCPFRAIPVNPLPRRLRSDGHGAMIDFARARRAENPDQGVPDRMEDYADVISTVALLIIFLGLALHFWERRRGKRNRDRDK